MIGYVTLGTNDLPRATAFYDALLEEIDKWEREEAANGTLRSETSAADRGRVRLPVLK